MFLSKCCHVPPITNLSEEGTGCFICPACDKGCDCYDTGDDTLKGAAKYHNGKEEEEPKAKKTATEYEVSYNNIKIKVVKSENGKLTIEPSDTGYNNDGFVVKGSKPSMVNAIGKILIKASDL